MQHARAVTLVPLLTIVAALAACSKSDRGAADTAAAGGTAAAASGGGGGGADAGSVNSTVRVTLTGGANAGSYDGQATSGGCSAGLTGPNSWGNQFSIDAKDAKQFSSLQLIVPDRKAAAAGTKDFMLTVGFGPLLSQKSYDIDPAKGKGSGTLKLDDSGSTAKVTFSGQTADGVKVEGTIDCKTVLRAG